MPLLQCLAFFRRVFKVFETMTRNFMLLYIVLASNIHHIIKRSHNPLGGYHSCQRVSLKPHKRTRKGSQERKETRKPKTRENIIPRRASSLLGILLCFILIWKFSALYYFLEMIISAHVISVIFFFFS